MLWKLEMINETTIEDVFLEDIDIEKVLVVNKIFSEETNNIYFLILKLSHYI